MLLQLFYFYLCCITNNTTSSTLTFDVICSVNVINAFLFYLQFFKSSSDVDKIGKMPFFITVESFLVRELPIWFTDVALVFSCARFLHHIGI